MSRAAADLQKLIDRMLAGDPAACGRLLSVVEELGDDSDAVLAAVFDRLGRAHRVGLTGPPGAGKSSLCFGLARLYRQRDQKVGVVAVDPTSPLTGGALLGDRIRLQGVATDPGVFIRSLASRDSFGGLSLAAGRVADVLDAFGSDVVLFETVGMGQIGHEVREEAATVVVVLVPESGDGIQLMKAGIFELADIFVVNKSDRPGAQELLGRLRELPARPQGRWQPVVIETCAVTGEGLPGLMAAIDSHRAFCQGQADPGRPDREFWTRRFLRLTERQVCRDLRGELAGRQTLSAEVGEVLAGRRSLASLLDETVVRFYRGRKA